MFTIAVIIATPFLALSLYIFCAGLARCVEHSIDRRRWERQRQ